MRLLCRSAFLLALALLSLQGAWRLAASGAMGAALAQPLCGGLSCGGRLGNGSRSFRGTPLPRVSHVTMQRHQVKGRLLLVGDVHGCIEELQNILREVSFRKGRDTLVLVGDLVNKGPDSAGVLRLARDFGALCVRGNHDDELLEAYYRTGRYADNLKAYKNNALEQVTGSDIEWVREWPLTISFPWLPLTVVHAGMVPGVPLEKQDFRHLLFMRNLNKTPEGGWQGHEKDVAESVPWATQWTGPPHVVFGHDARRKLQEAPWATGLDTGCCYGNQLTGLLMEADDFSSRRLVSVPAAKMYSIPKDTQAKSS